MESRSFHRAATALVAALAAVLLAGCNRTQVVIEMKPAGAGFQRRVTVYDIDPVDSLKRHLPPDLTSDLAARLARVYGVRVDTIGPYVAARRFASVPEDVGNWGDWRVARSPLGVAYEYRERLGGDTDPQAALSTRLAAADSLAAWLDTWSRSANGPPPRSRLAAYLTRDFGRELRNLVTLYWARGASADTDVAVLADIDAEEHAVAHDLWSTTTRGEWRMLLMNPPADTGAAALRSKVLAYLEEALVPGRGPVAGVRLRTARVQVNLALASYREGLPPRVDPDSLRWAGMHERLATIRTLYGKGTAADRVDVRLATGVRPYDTNGTWDEARGEVTWVDGALNAGCGELPMACQARWAVPDSARQRRLFGRVLLGNASLAWYCAWYAEQPKPRRAEWDRMLLALRPGDLGPLRRFEFAGERAAAPDSTRASEAAMPRRLILEAAGIGTEKR